MYGDRTQLLGDSGGLSESTARASRTAQQMSEHTYLWAPNQSAMHGIRKNNDQADCIDLWKVVQQQQKTVSIPPGSGYPTPATDDKTDSTAPVHIL